MALPKYVRLADHLTGGIRADLNSGFSIAGFDVVESPDEEMEPAAAGFVKAELSAGRMEGASKAEYDEVHPDLLGDLGYEVERKVSIAVVPQEGHIQRLAQGGNRAVRANRGAGAEEDVAAADEARRKEILKAQKKADKADKGTSGSEEPKTGS